jgi:hypothetical protein
VVKVSELARSVSSEAMGRINRIKAELHSAKEEALKARRRARHAGDQVGAGRVFVDGLGVMQGSVSPVQPADALSLGCGCCSVSTGTADDDVVALHTIPAG